MQIRQQRGGEGDFRKEESPNSRRSRGGRWKRHLPNQVAERKVRNENKFLHPVRSLTILVCSFIETEIVEKDGFFDIFYLLTEPGAYDVDVKFGGKQVPNGLMRMTVK